MTTPKRLAPPLCALVLLSAACLPGGGEESAEGGASSGRSRGGRLVLQRPENAEAAAIVQDWAEQGYFKGTCALLHRRFISGMLAGSVKG